jgi:hypothetical protein
MSTSSKNPLELQNELVKSVNNSSVTEGRPVSNNMTYPAVSSPMKTVPNKEGHFNIVDSAGNVVGEITTTIFGLVEDVSRGAIGTTANVVTAGIDMVKRVGTGVVDAGTDLVSAAADTLNKVSTTLVDGISSTVNKSVNNGSELVSTAKSTLGHVVDGVSSGVKKTVSTGSELVSTATDTLHDVVDGVSSGVKTTVNAGTELVSTATGTLHKVFNGVSTGIKKSVANGSGIVLDAANTLGDVSNHIVTGTATGLNNSINSLRNAILNTESSAPDNSLKNIKSSLFASRHSLKVASEKLSSVLSVANPDPVEVKVATAVVQSHAATEILNTASPNDVIKQTTSKVASVLNKSNVSNQEIKEANESLKESLSNNILDNIHESVFATNNASSNNSLNNVHGSVFATNDASSNNSMNNIHASVFATRNTLKEASQKLEEVLSVPNPDPVAVKVATAVVASQIKSELINPSSPNDEVKQSASNLATVIVNNQNPESIKEAVTLLTQSLSNNSLANIHASALQVSSLNQLSSPNSLGNIHASVFKSNSSLKEASEHLSKVLSVQNPNPSTVANATDSVKTLIKSELMNSDVPVEVKQSATKLATVIENNENHESIKNAVDTLQQSLGNIHPSVLATTSKSTPSLITSRHSLHESANVLLNELSKANPNPSIVNSASQVLHSHAEMESQNPNAPNDSVKSSALAVANVLEDPAATRESINFIVQTLNNELEHDKSPTIVSTIASGIRSVANGVINTTKNIVDEVVDGVQSVVGTATNIGSHVVNGVTGKSSEPQATETETGNNLVRSIKEVGNDIVTKMKDVTVKQDCDKLKQAGGNFKNGVSVLNIEDNSDVSTRMLVPNNFIATKHVYFVRYHPNGTNVYDYKFAMKGGKVNNLELKNVNSIWNNNNSVGSISSNTLSNGINVMNNIINNLSDSTQIGGYIRERISDKDEFYNEYKNYKLKYLSLKNKI